MARFSAIMLNLDGPDAPAVAAFASACADVEMAFDSISGDFDDILAAIADWAVLPEVIAVQAPEDRTPDEAIAAIGDALPAGEAEVVVFNVPNDIATYRRLRDMGVREIFSGLPTRSELAEVFGSILASALRRTGIDPRKAVWVWSASGGAGGTSLATTLARMMAREGRRTLFIDLDLATGPASFMFNAEQGARETTALVEALANPNRIDALFLERAIDIAEQNLFYLSARRRANDPEPMVGAINTLLARAQQNFDMVVVDVPWRVTPQMDMATVQGHSYVVAAPNPAGLLGFSILMRDLSATPGRSPVHGVVNRVGEYRSNDIVKANFRETGTKDLFQIPYDAAACGRMFFEQKSYAETSGRIRKAVARIARTLPGRAEDGTEAAAVRSAPRRVPGRKVRSGSGGWFARKGAR